MSPRSVRPRRFLVQLLAVTIGLASALATSAACADFSSPPESPYRYDDERLARSPEAPRTIVEEPEPPWQSRGVERTLRFHVGPALLLEPQGPGLLTALDIGRSAIGARASAAWMRAGSERGLSAYNLELWIDFRHRDVIHPIVGAGASFMRGGALGDASSVGAGVLRGAVEYALPVEGADARVALGVTALLPAVGTERARPWAIAALSLGFGF